MDFFDLLVKIVRKQKPNGNQIFHVYEPGFTTV